MRVEVGDGEGGDEGSGGGRGVDWRWSTTKEDFAKDWNDRLLSEYRLGWSEASFEFGTWDVTANLG